MKRYERILTSSNGAEDSEFYYAGSKTSNHVLLTKK